MSLPPDRLSRFARHIVLPELGGAGQVALTKAHVVLIGCGGIGSPARAAAPSPVAFAPKRESSCASASGTTSTTRGLLMPPERDVGQRELAEGTVKGQWVAAFRFGGVRDMESGHLRGIRNRLRPRP